MEDNEKQVEMFTNPKPVIIRRTSEIITTQAIICVVIAITFLCMKLFLPDMYGVIDNFLRQCLYD